MNPPWPHVNYLIRKFGLNECESADLSLWVEWLTCIDKNGADAYGHVRDDENVRNVLFTRAEVLSILGSPFQEMYDALESASGRKWGHDELTT